MILNLVIIITKKYICKKRCCNHLILKNSVRHCKQAYNIRCDIRDLRIYILTIFCYLNKAFYLCMKWIRRQTNQLDFFTGIILQLSLKKLNCLLDMHFQSTVNNRIRKIEFDQSNGNLKRCKMEILNDFKVKKEKYMNENDYSKFLKSYYYQILNCLYYYNHFFSITLQKVKYTDFVPCVIYTFLTFIKNPLHMDYINVYYINAYMVMFTFFGSFSVITLRINFVLYSQIKSNDV